MLSVRCFSSKPIPAINQGELTPRAVSKIFSVTTLVLSFR
jgi:hypothetical protein